MAQPPEDGSTTPPGAPREPAAADDATIPWTPPEPAAMDQEPTVEAAAELAVEPAVEPLAEPVVEPPSPLISWTPSGGASPTPPPVALPGLPGLPGVLPPAVAPAEVPLVGWQLPVGAAQIPTADGYAIASTWARLVAYMIDGILVAIIPILLSFWAVDFTGLMRDAIEAGRNGSGSGTFVTPITMASTLVTVVSVGISFLYFVGFWTSTGGATLGMRGLRMRVVDARSRDSLTLSQAIRRWVVLGAPLSLLGLIPALQSAAGFAALGLSLVLLITVATDDQRQGIHDKVAGSIVGRSVTSGAGATAVGCLLLIAISIGLAVVIGTIAANEMLPLLQEYIQELEPVS